MLNLRTVVFYAWTRTTCHCRFAVFMCECAVEIRWCGGGADAVVHYCEGGVVVVLMQWCTTVTATAYKPLLSPSRQIKVLALLF